MKYLFLIMIILTTACASKSDVSGMFNSSNPGYLSLDIIEAQDFDPTADHGKVLKYKLTITGSAMTEAIERYYPVGTEEVTFEGFPGGSTLRVMIEAININNICVRRGTSEDVTIKGGQNVSANITINNVPIFANVRNGATVYNNRFVPKIFAPGEITFQIADLFNGSQSVIVDQISNDSQFSINASDKFAIMTVNAPILTVGKHNLTVQDPETEELSDISITVLDGTNQKGLPTTSGNYVGSLMNHNHEFLSNFVTFHQFQGSNL